MTRPHPVIRITTELSDRTGRSKHHTNIVEYIVNNQEILVIIVERDHVCRLKFRIADRVADHLSDRIGSSQTQIFFFNIRDFTVDTVTDIHCLTQVTDTQTRNGQLFFLTLRNKTIFQIIMFNTTQLLDRAETTVMIGKDQSLFRYGNTGTSATKNHNSIGHTRVSFTVELLVGRNKSKFLDPRQVLFV